MSLPSEKHPWSSEAFLSRVGIETKVMRGHIFLRDCPWCGVRDKVWDGKVRVSVESGAWNTLCCGQSGGHILLYRETGIMDGASEIASVRDAVARLAARESTPGPSAPVAPTTPKEKVGEFISSCEVRLWAEDPKAVVARAWLVGIRLLDEATLRAWRIGCDERGMVTFPYFRKTGEPVFVKMRMPGDKKALKESGVAAFDSWPRRDDGREEIPENDPSRLFGISRIDPDASPSLVIVEGEIDALTASMLGVRNVIAVPGAAAWKSLYKNYFGGFKAILVATDNDREREDNPGELLAQRITLDLGSKRCVRVTFWDFKDLNAAAMALLGEGGGYDRLSEVLRVARRGIEVGRTAASIDTDYSVIPMDFWPNMNLAMLGGLREQELTVLTGNSGEGKTSFAFDLVERLRMSGYESVFVSLEMTRPQMKRREFTWVTGSLWGGWGSLSQKKDLNDIFADHIKDFPMMVSYPYSGNVNNVSDLCDTVFASAVDHRASIVVIDHLDEVLLLDKSNDQLWDKAQRVMAKLRELAARLKIHVMVICHQNIKGAGQGASRANIKHGTSIAQKADNVWIVRRQEATASGDSATVEIDKVREVGGKSGVKINFAYKGGRFTEIVTIPVSGAPAAPAGPSAKDPDPQTGLGLTD